MKNKIINFLLVFISIFVGLRIFNSFLVFQNRPKKPLIAYKKTLTNNEIININHPESFDIDSIGQNTILLIGDSFGVGKNVEI